VPAQVTTVSVYAFNSCVEIIALFSAQFSAIYANFRGKKWRFSQKPML
jgi:hypothetical protein